MLSDVNLHWPDLAPGSNQSCSQVMHSHIFLGRLQLTVYLWHQLAFIQHVSAVFVIQAAWIHRLLYLIRRRTYESSDFRLIEIICLGGLSSVCLSVQLDAKLFELFMLFLFFFMLLAAWLVASQCRRQITKFTTFGRWYYTQCEHLINRC